MTIQTFIEKAIDGGWQDNLFAVDTFSCGKTGAYFLDGLHHFIPAEILLDPLAWQAVGKVEGHGVSFITTCKRCSSKFGNLKTDGLMWWQYQMHEMIDALAEGKSIEEFLATL